MPTPDAAAALWQLVEPLRAACQVADEHDDFVLAAKLSDCIEWIVARCIDPDFGENA